MMNKELQYINELKSILNDCRFFDRAMINFLEAIIVIIILIVGVEIVKLVGMPLGYILIIIIVGFIVFLFDKFELRFNKAPQPIGKVAYRACVIMDNLIYIKQNNQNFHNCARVINVSTGKHIELYNKFVSLYPQLQSKELMKLSKIEVEFKDID